MITTETCFLPCSHACVAMSKMHEFTQKVPSVFTPRNWDPCLSLIKHDLQVFGSCISIYATQVNFGALMAMDDIRQPQLP